MYVVKELCKVKKIPKIKTKLDRAKIPSETLTHPPASIVILDFWNCFLCKPLRNVSTRIVAVCAIHSVVLGSCANLPHNFMRLTNYGYNLQLPNLCCRRRLQSFMTRLCKVLRRRINLRRIRFFQTR